MKLFENVDAVKKNSPLQTSRWL